MWGPPCPRPPRVSAMTGFSRALLPIAHSLRSSTSHKPSSMVEPVFHAGVRAGYGKAELHGHLITQSRRASAARVHDGKREDDAMDIDIVHWAH
jgi:hypothetical protein